MYSFLRKWWQPWTTIDQMKSKYREYQPTRIYTVMWRHWTVTGSSLDCRHFFSKRSEITPTCHLISTAQLQTWICCKFVMMLTQEKQGNMVHHHSYNASHQCICMLGKSHSNLHKIGSFNLVLQFYPVSKTDHHDRTSDVEIGVNPQSIQYNGRSQNVTINL